MAINISEKMCRGNQNIFIFKNYFSENRVVYRIVLKNMVQPDRPQIAMLYGSCAWRARYITLCFEPLTSIICFFVPRN